MLKLMRPLPPNSKIAFAQGDCSISTSIVEQALRLPTSNAASEALAL